MWRLRAIGGSPVKALVLVAHPDDELLFAGQLMLDHPEWNWTQVCLTNGRPFPGVTLGFADEWRILHRTEYEAWRAGVDGLGLAPDLVVTHNRMGEYGHPHHMAVHAIAHELFPRVWDFYTDAPSSVGPQAIGEQTWAVPVGFAKRERFEATYPGVYAELAADKPELIEAVFRAEWFTA